MFEWFEDTREWFDTEGGGWDGDVTVSLPAALTISFSAVNDVAVVGHANIYVSTIVMSVDAKAATVSHDYTVICGSAISAAISLNAPALTIFSTIVIASALSIAATVQDATASHATRPAAPLIWLYLTPKQPALTITSDVPISGAITLAITQQEPPHAGVVEMVFVDEALEIAFDFLASTPILYEVNVPVDCISASLALNDASIEFSSSVAVAQALPVYATMRSASVRLDCTQTETAPLAALVEMQEHTAHGSVNVAVPIGGPIGATLTLKTSAVRYSNVVSITAAAHIAAAVNAPAILYDYFEEVEALTIEAEINSNLPTYGWLHPVAAALTIAQSLLEPAAISLSSAVRPTSPLRQALAVQAHVASASSNIAAPAPPGMVLTLNGPEFYGPLRPEFVLLKSPIVPQLDLTSELNIRMAAYG